MRQFIVGEELDACGEITVRGKDFRYLAQVLRLQPDDLIEARLKDGGLCKMAVKHRGKASLVLQRVENGSASASSAHPPEGAAKAGGGGAGGGVSAASVEANAALRFYGGKPCGYGAAIWLLQLMPKAAKLDSIIRQAAEMGVERVFPVAGEFSVYAERGANGAKLERWNRIVKEARQQSASPIDTQIAPPAAMQNALAILEEELAKRAALCASACGDAAEGAGADAEVPTKPCGGAFSVRKLVLCEDPALPLENKTLHGQLLGKVDVLVLAVGPEGGISPAELRMLRENGFAPVHFATNVLRAETAAVYGIAAAQTLLTESSAWQNA